MDHSEIIQVAAFIVCLVALTPLLGRYLMAVFEGKLHFLRGVENGFYRLCGINPTYEMLWTDYAKALLIFNSLGLVMLIGLQRLQYWLPLNPQEFPAVPWALAFNTAISFVTNTNWQAYAGETTLSYLTQMLGLAVQNFLSAATGFAVLLTLIRGLSRKLTSTLGNFWVDLVRATLYVLLPLSIVLALVLVSQGVIQNLNPYVEAVTLEKQKQTIPMGPAASQVAIKQLGTNGGGFFNANSAHPFENPTDLSNFLEMLAILLLPAASIYAYGLMVGSKRHGWLLLIVTLILWVIGFLIALWSDLQANPALGVDRLFEGQELRFGTVTSIAWATATTATANGSINASLDSLNPIAGGICLFNILMGELIFGGIGVGLCTLVIFAILTVFLAGLLVGRTPEYLGKKIGQREMLWVAVAILTPGFLTLAGAGIACLTPSALTSIANPGPHGLTEVLYAFASAAGNNGSAFGGLDANTNFYNVSLGIIMLGGRLAIVIPTLVLASNLAKKKLVPPSPGTMNTDSGVFATLLIVTILMIGALTFFPAISLGPIVERLLMTEGQTF